MIPGGAFARCGRDGISLFLFFFFFFFLPPTPLFVLFIYRVIYIFNISSKSKIMIYWRPVRLRSSSDDFTFLFRMFILCLWDRAFMQISSRDTFLHFFYLYIVTNIKGINHSMLCCNRRITHDREMKRVTVTALKFRFLSTAFVFI